MPTHTDDERPDKPVGDRPGDRIAKLLARAGIASRREVERMIADGRIALDGVAVDTPATVLRSLHGVTVDGRPVAQPAPARLFLHHKPAGLLVTERDPAGRPTIYDRLPADLPRVVPVGRLDLATEGLLLLTTDGGLKRELELPATGVERAYRARAYGDVTQAQLEELIEGVEIDGIRYGPIDANLERRTGANVWIELILTEGKNREVRRVLEHLGLQVGRLIRTRYGPFILGDLPPGGVGEVRQADLVAFRRTLGGKGGGSKRAPGEERIAVAVREAPAPAPKPEPTPEPARPAPPPAATPRPPRAKGGWGTQARPSRPKPAADGPARPPRARDDEPARPPRARDDDAPRTRRPRDVEPRADQHTRPRGREERSGNRDTSDRRGREGRGSSPDRSRAPEREGRPGNRDTPVRHPREGGGPSPDRARRATGGTDERARNAPTRPPRETGSPSHRAAAGARGERPDTPRARSAGQPRSPDPARRAPRRADDGAARPRAPRSDRPATDGPRGSGPRKPSGRPPRGKR